MSDIDQRVARTEAAQARTEANLEQMSKQMADFVGEVREGFVSVRTEMRETREQQARLHSESVTRGQSKMGNFATWAGIGVVVLLAIAGGFSSGYIRDQDRHEKEIAQLWQMAVTGVGNDRDSDITRARLRIDVDRLSTELASGIKGLDEKLQRETALMNQVTERATDELGKRLDGELRWLYGAVNALDQRSGGAGLVAPRGHSDNLGTKER